MGETDGKPAKDKADFTGQGLFCGPGAHVAVHGIHDLLLERLKDTQVGEVTGVDNDRAVAEAVADQPFESAVRADEVSIGKDAGFDRHGERQ